MNPDIKKKYLERKAKKAEKTSTYVDLSDNIAISIMEALKIANINKTEFAKRLGKETSVVSRWLNGQHNFTIKTIVDIENALKQKIVFPLNKIPNTENLNQHLIILNYDGTYKNDFSKLQNNEKPSGKKFTLTNAYGNTLVFNT